MDQASPAAPAAHSTGHDPNETRTRLLDTAERLFADFGFNGVSMRTITGEAGVNLAAAHYHFRSKEGLYRAVFERRVVPMNEERAQLLDACLAQEARSGHIDPAAVLDAFIGPAIRISNSPGAENFRRLSGRASADPSPEVRRVVYELYDPVAARFVDLLAKACPDLSREDLFWRLACAYGAMMYVRADSGRLQQLMGLDLAMSDSAAAMRHLIPFLSAGFAQPSVEGVPFAKAQGRAGPGAKRGQAGSRDDAKSASSKSASSKSASSKGAPGKMRARAKPGAARAATPPAVAPADAPVPSAAKSAAMKRKKAAAVETAPRPEQARAKSMRASEPARHRATTLTLKAGRAAPGKKTS